uniref:Adipose-secreted signaling protein n=1 Tax=Macrostomum lignano TaxID=282301 RepID=A0A1I8HH81_9PLAT
DSTNIKVSRPAEEPGSHGRQARRGRVHFNPDHLLNHTDDITIERGTDGESIDIQLGFLQVGHVYEIMLPALRHQLGQNPVSNSRSQVKLLSCCNGSDGDQFVFQLFAQTEGLMLATVLLKSSTTDQMLIVRFHGRVLGKLMGTPGLKNGVRSVAIREPDAAVEEASDSEL